MDQCCSRGEITLLIMGHQHFQIAVWIYGGNLLTHYYQDHRIRTLRLPYSRKGTLDVA